VRSGAVLRGPAREPVETYETRVEGDNLEIVS
jgi:nitrite reductase/ring-hydroxylating ferredoxin subunit